MIWARTTLACASTTSDIGKHHLDMGKYHPGVGKHHPDMGDRYLDMGKHHPAVGKHHPAVGKHHLGLCGSWLPAKGPPRSPPPQGQTLITAGGYRSSLPQATTCPDKPGPDRHHRGDPGQHPPWPGGGKSAPTPLPLHPGPHMGAGSSQVPPPSAVAAVPPLLPTATGPLSSAGLVPHPSPHQFVPISTHRQQRARNIPTSQTRCHSWLVTSMAPGGVALVTPPHTLGRGYGDLPTSEGPIQRVGSVRQCRRGPKLVVPPQHFLRHQLCR